MKTTNYTKVNLIPILFTGLLVLFFASCGTHSSNDYGDRDGIYSNEEEVTEAETTNNDKNSYYKQYFKTKELAYKDIPEENAIFTDIDEYYTTETVDEDGYIVTEERETEEEEYGAWGTNTDDITINIYGGYSYGYWHRPYWWYGSYWGYPYFYGYGWGYPYYWGMGYYGWGYPYYGYYGNWYGHHHHYYGNGYYNSYAYNRGRRNTSYAYSRGNYNSRGRSNLNSGRESYSRMESNRRNTYTDSRRSNNENRVYRRSNSVNSRNVTQNRRSRSNNTINKRSNTVRRNTNSRSNNFNNRSNNSRRSSGSYRSSGSSRSSGSMRSGGGSSRGSSSGSRRGGRG